MSHHSCQLADFELDQIGSRIQPSPSFWFPLRKKQPWLEVKIRKPMQTFLRLFSVALVSASFCLLTASGATTNAISPGEIKAGSISAPTQTNFYTFPAASNDVVYVTLLLTNGPGSGPQFYLYDPDRVDISSG